MGCVWSILSVTVLEAVPPALVALHVSVEPAVSATIVVGSHPVVETIGDSGSVTFHVTETALLYQPLSPLVPDTLAVIDGAVVSGNKGCQAGS